MIFAQIPNLPDRPIGFLRGDSTAAGVSDGGLEAAGGKETGRRDDKTPPPRYDRPGLMPGSAADERGERPQSSTKQSYSKFHGAILSHDIRLDSPGPES
jgi:hypothetical protein